MADINTFDEGVSPEVRAVMEQMLADTQKTAQQMLAGALRERRKAAATLQEARKEYDKALSEADQVRADLEEAYYARHQAASLKRVQANWVGRLRDMGHDVGSIAALLPIPREIVEELFRNDREEVPPLFRDDVPAGQIAKISYTSMGRGGYVLLDWGGQTARFWWEFGGGKALAVVEAPEAAHWEAQTGIPLEARDRVVLFIARQVARDHSRDGHYKIYSNSITIYR